LAIFLLQNLLFSRFGLLFCLVENNKKEKNYRDFLMAYRLYASVCFDFYPASPRFHDEKNIFGTPYNSQIKNFLLLQKLNLKFFATAKQVKPQNTKDKNLGATR